MKTRITYLIPSLFGTIRQRLDRPVQAYNAAAVPTTIALSPRPLRTI